MIQNIFRSALIFFCFGVVAAVTAQTPATALKPSVIPGDVVSINQAKIVVNGNLAGIPNRDAKLAPLVPGRIARVLVTEGEGVKAGQLLAELDNAQLKDQERQAEAAVAQAQANLENARVSAQRNENLLQRGIASRKEVEDAKTQLAVSEAGAKQASAALSVARGQLGRAEIRAPFAGTVVRRFLGVGDQVDGSGGQPIVEVADIKLGQYLSLELPSKESSPKLVVPKQAIYPGESGEPHVYVVKGDEADMVPVVVGAQAGEQAEIVSGVNAGDSVIVNGGYGLPEKSKVRVKGSTAR